ncbi:MAG TPA: purine-nucleoside phosphorylase [Gemmatimonadaceae bacterium]|nr:purine-nucleoside phosphorylase [Gemmatimonadaceae bacterium]
MSSTVADVGRMSAAELYEAGAGLHTLETVERAAARVRERWPYTPEVAVILGTGLGRLAAAIESPTIIDYPDIPDFPRSTVESHAGRLICGTLGGKLVVAMQGRLHRYEGYTLQQVTFPVRVLRALGAECLIVSNACGTVRPEWRPGDLMLIADHVNLLGDNPLIGPNDGRLGPRFPDMSRPYDEALRALARDVARAGDFTLREGVYAAVSGPSLETRAEYAMLRTMGADVVGMSTVPEVIVAVHGGLRVLGISIVTDKAVPETLEATTLEQIVAAANAAEPALTALVRGVITRL